MEEDDKAVKIRNAKDTILGALKHLPNEEKRDIIKEAIAELDDPKAPVEEKHDVIKDALTDFKIRQLQYEKNKIDKRVLKIDRELASLKETEFSDIKAWLNALLLASPFKAPVPDRIIKIFLESLRAELKKCDVDDIEYWYKTSDLKFLIWVIGSFSCHTPMIERDMETLVCHMNRAAILDPIPPTLRSTIELALAKFIHMLAGSEPNDDLTLEATRRGSEHLLRSFPNNPIFEYLRKPSNFMGDKIMFLNRWAASGYSNVHMTAKLGAALSFSDVPEDFVDQEVHLPWPAFFISFKDPILSIQGSPVHRIWVQELNRTDDHEEKWMMSLRTDTVDDWTVLSKSLSGLRAKEIMGLPSEHPLPESSIISNTFKMAANLVIGTCIRMSHREDVRQLTHASSKKGNRLRFSKLPETSDYVIGGDVKVDCVQAVRDICLGHKPRTYKVQWLVRGHYRRQPYGKNREQYYRKWIEPFWKGPERLPILMRSHVLENPPSDEKKELK